MTLLVDANLLLYALVRDFDQHTRSRYWLESQLEASVSLALPWPTLLAYLRLSTNPRVFESPRSMASAWRDVRALLSQPSVWTPEPTDRHPELLGQLLHGLRRSALVHDAHLAALAIEHDLVLCSADSDFDRFPGLEVWNPLR